MLILSIHAVVSCLSDIRQLHEQMMVYDVYHIGIYAIDMIVYVQTCDPYQLIEISMG